MYYKGAKLNKTGIEFLWDSKEGIFWVWERLPRFVISTLQLSTVMRVSPDSFKVRLAWARAVTHEAWAGMICLTFSLIMGWPHAQFPFCSPDTDESIMLKTAKPWVKRVGGNGKPCGDLPVDLWRPLHTIYKHKETSNFCNDIVLVVITAAGIT